MPTKSLSAALTEPFDDDQIGKVTKKGKRFSNVSPVHYVERLVNNHPLGYDVIEGDPAQVGHSIVVPVEVRLHDGDQVRVSRASGASPLQDENGNDLDAGDAVKSAASDGLKRALMKYGMGTHLYHEQAESVGDESAAPKKSISKPASKPTPQVQDDEDEDEEDAPPPKRKTTSSKPAGSNWESKREKFTYPMGKNKGTSYSDLEANFLTWAEENLDPDDEKYGKKNAEILKCVQDEIKYRKDNGEWAPKKKASSKPTKKRSIGDDDEDTEF